MLRRAAAHLGDRAQRVERHEPPADQLVAGDRRLLEGLEPGELLALAQPAEPREQRLEVRVSGVLLAPAR